jgi:hypothetical protein
MRCATHILNLVVSDGLKEMDDSVKRLRDAVRFIKNSPSRLVKFKKIAEEENVQINALLKLDVCTRWNSTYLMLNSTISYDKVFAKYEEEDPTYTIELWERKVMEFHLKMIGKVQKRWLNFLAIFMISLSCFPLNLV